METQVLIPQEFSLVVTASGARNSGEPLVSVWTTNRIKQGALYYPFQGTVRIDNLDIYSYIDEEDVSTCFFSYTKIYHPCTAPHVAHQLCLKCVKYITC